MNSIGTYLMNMILIVLGIELKTLQICLLYLYKFDNISYENVKSEKFVKNDSFIFSPLYHKQGCIFIFDSVFGPGETVTYCCVPKTELNGSATIYKGLRLLKSKY